MNIFRSPGARKFAGAVKHAIRQHAIKLEGTHRGRQLQVIQKEITKAFEEFLKNVLPPI